MLKATLLLKRRAKISILYKQAVADGYFVKIMQAHHLLRQIDEQLLGLTSQKPFHAVHNNRTMS